MAGMGTSMHRAAAALFALVLLAGPGGTGVARAAAPMQKTQVPGWYRMMLGDYEVTALWDGALAFKVHDLLKQITPAQLDADLARANLKEPVDFSVNVFLVNTGSKLVLFDTGLGGLMGGAGGKLLANLQAAGYRPEQVDEIYITHMHGDHIGGLTVNGKPAFPNANVHCSQTEADYWLSETKMKAAPAGAQDSFKTAMAAFQPYIASKHYQPFRGNVQLLPGIDAIAAPGHTPGHTIYRVSSRNATMIVWGDLMHVAAVQFVDPSVTITFDSDPAAAAQERKRVFAEVASRGDWVAGAHLPFPGIGHLRTPGGAPPAPSASYTFVPVLYKEIH